MSISDAQSNNKSNNINEQTIRKIARLARIGITDDQVEGFGGDLNKILNTVNSLQEVETGKIKPMMHPLDITQNLTSQNITEHRLDEVTEAKGVHPNIKHNAPHGDSEFYFLTPKVLK
jgi:aspartyl-tRNA(Asn)/glutamyl-tRNA(Gln) amidotransferase subunit C